MERSGLLVFMKQAELAKLSYIILTESRKMTAMAMGTSQRSPLSCIS